jgi:D-3-phosphoglycerate dehydrogenase
MQGRRRAGQSPMTCALARLRTNFAAQEGACMKGLFIDATAELAGVLRHVRAGSDPVIDINETADIDQACLPQLLAGYQFLFDDHSALPTQALAKCTDLKHVIFLGTGARSYMNPEELAALGITVHIIKGYGDTAVAEHTIALMWAASRGLARMDREMRAGHWLRTEGMQLTGKTIGLIGYGGIAAEVARIAVGSGMKVLAWNRSPKAAPGVEFVSLERLLAESHVVSLHLLLNDETRGFLSAERIAQMRPGAILVNTARGALVDEAAMIAALRSGQIGHAALDVFDVEPLPFPHPLSALECVTLAAHSAFRTPEATQTLIRRAVAIARDLVA